MDNNRSLLKELEDKLFILEEEYIRTIPDPTGELNNVLQGLRNEFFCTRLDDYGQEKDILSLIYVNGTDKVRGHLCQVSLFHQSRNDIVFGFSKFLEKEYSIDFFKIINHWQSTIRTAFEKLEYFTVTSDDAEKLAKGSIVLKGRKGLQIIPFVNKLEMLKELFSSWPELVSEKNYVYLMMDKSGFYKIGRSKNPIFRERTLKSQENSTQTIAYWEAPKEMEAQLHSRYNEFRIRGEWFKLNTIQLGEIASIMKDYIK